MEVDPFEARMEFLGLLGKLNASQHSIQKVGNFAMRNRNLHEDLYSCIVEELEQTRSINAKMNIFYVLDSICHQSQKAGFSGYVDLIQRNLTKIIECVTPSGPKGNVNVAGTKKILDSWRAKKLFHESVIDKVEKPLLSRDLGAGAPATMDGGFSKDDILKRMDEDRERHKRIREEIWIRPSDEDPAAEFSQNWEETSDVEDNDYEDMENENEKYLPRYPWVLEFDRFLPSPAIFKSKPPSVSAEPSSDSSVAGVKRLASPEGTVTLSSASSAAQVTGPLSVADSHHSSYLHQPERNLSHYQQQPPPLLQRQIHQPTSGSTSALSNSNGNSNGNNNSNNNGGMNSRNQSHAYYNSSIPTAPAAETTPYSHRISPTSRHGSPLSSYHSYPRQYYERAYSNNASTPTGHVNGHGERVP